MVSQDNYSTRGGKRKGAWHYGKICGKERVQRQMKVKILATGSGGNCVLIENRILIDAGITVKAFRENGLEPNGLDALLITHKHADHMKTPLVRYLLGEGVKAFLPASVIAELTKEGKIDMLPLTATGQVVPIQDEGAVTYGGMSITPYPQKHHDMVNYAFVLEKEGERLLYATDLDTVSATDMGVGLLHLGTFDTILLEGNYDEDYLRRYIEYMISLVPEADDPAKASDEDLEKWVRMHYHFLPDEVARNAFRAIQNRRHLSKQQARAYAAEHLKPNGTYYEIHRSSQFYEEPVGWNDDLIASELEGFLSNRNY